MAYGWDCGLCYVLKYLVQENNSLQKNPFNCVLKVTVKNLIEINRADYAKLLSLILVISVQDVRYYTA